MAGLSLAALVVAGGLTWVVASPETESSTYTAPAPRSTPAVVEAAGAARALQRLADAVTDGDRAAATSLAAPTDTAASSLLGDLVDGAVASRLREVTMRYVDEQGAIAADGTWAAAVDVTWAYAGFDVAPTNAEVLIRFRATGETVTVVGIGGGELRTPVWMSGPLEVSRTRDLLVVVAGGQDAERYVALARTAVPVVAGALPQWRGRLVVEVPADGAALERALGVEPGYYAQIAAVTGAGGAVVRGAPIHVFVNPDVFGSLGRAGQEVVLAHEATHVATDAPLSSAPTWLVEGFADYVALRDTRLPLTRTAAQVARQVRQDGLPAALPTADEFDTQGPHLGAVYESSWLVCETLAGRRGPEALERFYTAVSQGAPLDEQLAQRFGWTETELVAAWQARLTALPGPADGSR